VRICDVGIEQFSSNGFAPNPRRNNSNANASTQIGHYDQQSPELSEQGNIVAWDGFYRDQRPSDSPALCLPRRDHKFQRQQKQFAFQMNCWFQFAHGEKEDFVC
jgi:hypothetical protein